MFNKIVISAAAIILEFSMLSFAVAQSDPVAERQARNAQLERVSPVMEREKAYTPSEQELATQNIREVHGLLTSINSTLSDLALLGTRADQAKLLLSVDKTARETLTSLFESETARIKAARAESAVSEPQRSVSANPVTLQPKPLLAAVIPPQSNEHIKPIAVRSYENPARPTKVIFLVGKRAPEVVYVGGQVEINGTRFKLASVVVVRTSEKRHARPVYEITLRSDIGEIRKMEWE